MARTATPRRAQVSSTSTIIDAVLPYRTIATGCFLKCQSIVARVATDNAPVGVRRAPYLRRRWLFRHAVPRRAPAGARHNADCLRASDEPRRLRPAPASLARARIGSA